MSAFFEDSRGNALKHAYKLLGYRDRSEREIFERLLLKGFSEGVARETVTYLKDKGFINDRKVAESLRRYAVENRGLGRKGVIQYLVKRGISEDIAGEVGGDEPDYLEIAQRLVVKKLKLLKGCDSETVKRRLWGLLSRRGFSGEIIYKVMKDNVTKEEER